MAAAGGWSEPRSVDAPAWYEKALAVAGFIIVLGTFKQILPGVSDSRTGGSLVFQLVSGGIYFGGFFLLLYRGFPVSRLGILIKGWPLVAFTLLPIVSVTWSQDPDTSFRRAAALTLGLLFAYFIVVRFDFRTIVNLLVLAFLIYVVAGFGAVLTGDGITPGGPYSGAWRGFTGNKNEFGRTLALIVAVTPSLVLMRLIDRPQIALGGAALAFLLLLLSDSATSFVAAVGSVALGTIVYWLLGGALFAVRFSGELRAMTAVAIVLAAFLIGPIVWVPGLEAIGRDATLTGRTDLWAWAIDVNRERMLLGSGYRTFWIDDNTRYFFVDFAWNMDNEGNRSDNFAGPTHAHSGYVDVLLELGYLGVVSLCLMIVSSFANISRAVRNGNDQVGFIFAVILSFLLIYAIPAKSILQQSEDLWFIFTLVYLFSVKGRKAKPSESHDRVRPAPATAGAL